MYKSNNEHNINNSVEASGKAKNELSRNCFLQNAFLFLDNAERIMSDPRMSMARVSVSNGLAYMGPFPSASLGIYLDWWLNSGLEDIVHDKDGRRALTWHISGSPLTGMNSCSCVYPDGTTAVVHHSCFAKIRKTFSEAIIRRHAETPSADIFTIEEVAEILKTNATTENEILRARLAVQQRMNTRLYFNLNQALAKYQDAVTRYESICIKCHKEELSAFHKELLCLTTETERELQAISTEVSVSRNDYREGSKSKEEHDALMLELNKRRSGLTRQLEEFKDAGIARLTANGDLTKEIIESYLQNQNRS